MWLERFTKHLLKHRWQALALVFFGTFIPVIGTVGIVVAALVTFVRGIAEGALFMLAATLPYAISFFVTGEHQHAIPLVMWAAVGVAVLSNVLTWIFAVMLKRKASWSTILQLAALLGVLVISIVHLAYPEVSTWWSDQLHAYYTQVSSLKEAPKAVVLSNDVQTEAINATKVYATGLMVAAVLFNAILQLVIARWWFAIVFQPRTLHKELQGIRLSHLAGLLYLLSLGLAYWGNLVVLDMMPVLYLLFGAAGLSLIHYLFGLSKAPNNWFWILLLYITLLISLPYGLMLVSIIALFDVWTDFRKRFQKV